MLWRRAALRSLRSEPRSYLASQARSHEIIYIARGALDERTRAGLMLVAYRAITEATSLVARILVALHAWLIVCVNTDVTMGNW